MDDGKFDIKTAEMLEKMALELAVLGNKVYGVKEPTHLYAVNSIHTVVDEARAHAMLVRMLGIQRARRERESAAAKASPVVGDDFRARTRHVPRVFTKHNMSMRSNDVVVSIPVDGGCVFNEQDLFKRIKELVEKVGGEFQ